MIAAHHVRHCPYIIEIGSNLTPITDFLHHRYKQVVCVDPLLIPREENGILHVAADYHLFDFSPFMHPPFALVLLGMDLLLHDTLLKLCWKAHTIIIEFASTYTYAATLFEELRQQLDVKIDLQVGLDLSGNDFGDLTGSSPVFPQRMLYVLSQDIRHLIGQGQTSYYP